MILLSGNSLGKRQQELNSKVNEAAASNISFEDVQSETEQTDVDTFFKIDLASKYKNIDYIIEILKSGDSLHITRALKLIWLYDDEHSNIINPDYLNTKVFPMMSLKLKRKLLTVVSTHVRNEERANTFYKYCRANTLPEIAFKFLINASECTKLQFLQDKMDSESSRFTMNLESKKLQFLQDKMNSFDHMVSERNDKYMKHFIGKSFTLANAYLKSERVSPNHALYGIRHLYSVSDIKFLELIDKYGQPSSSKYIKNQLGLRVSKNIMEKYKDRVLKNPPIYLEMLNKSMLVKHSSSENVKHYLVALLQNRSFLFWDIPFFKTYKYLVDLIPLGERFQLVKKIFTDSYPGEEFEMTFIFYKKEYYLNLMTVKEREMWALKHIQSQKEILGNGTDYIWYKFVNFSKAFAEIKKYVMITPGKDKRNNMLQILIESAKTQNDLVILFNHYYQRHVNEECRYKQVFLQNVMASHNILEFDEECWTPFNKLLHSIDLYKESSGGSFFFLSSSCASWDMESGRGNSLPSFMSLGDCKNNFIALILFYHIVHKKDVPEELNKILDDDLISYSLRANFKFLDSEKKEMVYQYTVQYYLKIIDKFDHETYNEEVKSKVRKYIDHVVNLLKIFEKTKKDCPEIVEKYINLDKETYRHDAFFCEHEHVEKFTQEHCVRHLKEDAALVIEDLSLIKNESVNRFYLTKLLRKLKIYFSNDVAKVYLDFFINLLSETEPHVSSTKIQSSVHGIFQLADNRFKIDFMMKHVPARPKIEHDNMDLQLHYIQEYICRCVSYSRPPVPLPNVLMYIKGDYVHYCLPMFNMYLANLPIPQCLQFIEAILDTPLSIQKHGVRMAFKCFNTDNLNKLILSIWKKTKNISLRMIIYKKFHNKIVEENESAQKQLFETLKILTCDLHEDDDNELFALITSNKLPQCFICDFYTAGWKAVSKFTNKAMNLERMKGIINNMGYMIDIMQKAAIKPIVDDHIKTMLIDEQIHASYDTLEQTELNKAKWNLIGIYLMNIKSEDDLNDSLVLIRTITKRCFEMWDVKHSHLYTTVRHFYPRFISQLESESLRHDRMNSDDYSIVIFKTLLKDLEESLPLHRSYLHVWNLRLTIIYRDVLKTVRFKPTDASMDENKLPLIKECVLNFSRQLASLIKEFVQKELYFKSLFTCIKRVVEEKLKMLHSQIHYRTHNLYLTDVYIIAANGLLEFEMPEIYLLALNLLPLDYNRGYHDDDYVHAIKKLRATENPEIQCNMYERFVNTDFV